MAGKSKTPLAVERPGDKPDLKITSQTCTHMVFALKEGEWLDMLTSSTPGRHRAVGPAIVQRQLSPTGCYTHEMDIGDPIFWKWMGMLIKHGADHFGMTVESETQPLVLDNAPRDTKP